MNLEQRRERVVLISCGRKKLAIQAKARDLYSSTRFKNALVLAEAIAEASFVVSAKHGLVGLETLLDPYDENLKDLPTDRQLSWAQLIGDQLRKAVGGEKEIVLIVNNDYKNVLSPALITAGFEVTDPFPTLDDVRLEAKLSEYRRVIRRTSLALELYKIIEARLRRNLLHTLEDMLSETLPKRGVYVFIDPAERSSLLEGMPRIVRIGTHAVSTGSKSTLRNRLRTHFGTSEGSGSHRSSVFRLHIGEALIRKEVWRTKYPEWGVGSSASQEIRTNERYLEENVSQYLKRLLLLVLDVDDLPGPESKRARIERALISLLTEKHRYLETADTGWLGNFSAQSSIRESGLWNVRCVGAQCDFQIIRLALNILRLSN